MRIEPELGACSIVLVGSFNPSIFTPQWFARYKVVSEREAEQAQVNIIHPEINNVSVGSKTITVELNRFSVESAEGPWITLSDFLVKTFGELVPHTPISRLGINRMVHFSVGSETQRNRIGRLLAPLAPWGEWGKVIDEAPRERRGGFINLTMQETRLEGDLRGHIQATVQPSTRIPGNGGIFMAVNDEYVWSNASLAEGARPAIDLLSGKFENSIRRAEWIIDQVMALKDGGSEIGNTAARSA